MIIRKIFSLLEIFKSKIRIVFFKIIYNNRIRGAKHIRFRKRLNINIGDQGELYIGNNVFFNNDVSINVLDNIFIGNDVLVGENVKIYDHNHVFGGNSKVVEKHKFKTEPVKIGNNVWIGSNVVILKGTNIGDRSIIAAGSVVSENVPSDVIYRNDKSINETEIMYYD